MKNLYFLLAIILLLGSCGTDEIDITNETPVYVPIQGELVESTVRGMVVDENGEGVENAFVSYNNLSAMTNEEGRFILEGQLDAAGTYLRVIKSGYFSGSRKFTTTADAVNFVDIQLVERTQSGTINAAIGGSVTIDGSEVQLPSGSYTTEDGEAYSGEVEVYAHYMDPTERATFDQMPGDLIGFTTEGELQGLATYGMMNVELQDAAGNHLNLPEEQTATLTMPVPSELSGTAPASIPLWYFDEDKGIWIEEGAAQLVNGEYIGEVSHFTTWNCDIPYDFVCIEGFLNFNNNDASNFTLQFSAVDIGRYGYTTTNNRGYFNIKVPKDLDLTLTVSAGCGNAAQDIPLGSYSTDTNVGVINVSGTVEDFTIVGSVESCGGGVPAVGQVQVSIEGVMTIIDLESDGSFEHTFNNCAAADVFVAGVDLDNLMISENVQITSSGYQDVGVLETCEDYALGTTIIYEGQNWALNGGIAADSFLLAVYSDVVLTNPGEPDKIIRTVTVLDWLTAEVAEGDFIFEEGDSEATYTMSMPQGFDISGTCSLQVAPSFLVTDTSTEITVTDATIYPGNVDEVFFYIKI